MTTRIKKSRWIHVLGVGGVCAACATSWIDSGVGQELAPPTAVDFAEELGPVLAAPRVATRPEEREDPAMSRRGNVFLFELPADPNESFDGGASLPTTEAPFSDSAANESTATKAARALTPELAQLRDRMKACSEFYSQRPESTAERSPWGIMHSLIAYGADTEIVVGNRRVNAIGWLLWNGNCRGQQLLHLQNGQIAAHFGQPGLQGHPGQLLAMLAQWRVRPETPMKIEGKDFTVADLIEYEKRTCEPKSELTFKLIALSYYLNSDATWTDVRGRTWSVSKLIQEELAQPIVGAACGGTHRMMGFSYAIRMRERDGKPLDGQWARAKSFVDDYHEYTFALQNADGSFSTRYFEGRGDFGDIPKRVETTGHIFEWLAYSLPDDQLFDPRMVRAATYLTDTMIQYRNRKLEVGPKGHALHGLNIYLDRSFSTKPEYMTPQVARRRAGEQR